MNVNNSRIALNYWGSEIFVRSQWIWFVLRNCDPDGQCIVCQIKQKLDRNRWSQIFSMTLAWLSYYLTFFYQYNRRSNFRWQAGFLEPTCQCMPTLEIFQQEKHSQPKSVSNLTDYILTGFLKRFQKILGSKSQSQTRLWLETRDHYCRPLQDLRTYEKT